MALYNSRVSWTLCRNDQREHDYNHFLREMYSRRKLARCCCESAHESSKHGVVTFKEYGMTLTVQQEAYIDSIPKGLFIEGVFEELTKECVEVVNPATGRVLATVSHAEPEDGLRALESACAVSSAWASTSPRHRSEILRRAFELVYERKDHLATVMTLEMGKPLNEAYAELRYAAEFLRWFSEEAVRVEGRYVDLPEGGAKAIISYLPVGPCFLITPWNFPLAMAARKIAPALAAGCVSVLKPAALTPLTSLLFGQILQDAGVPDGVVNIVTTRDSAALSSVMLQDKRLCKLSFTGSTQVGKHLLAQASSRVLRTSMELGGNAPFLVFEDADIDLAVEGAILAKFRNIGQACTALNRLYLHEAIATPFLERLCERVAAMKVGSGLDPDVVIGPMITQEAVFKTQKYVDNALDRGAKLLVGGQAHSGCGYFFEPTVLRDVDTELVQQEMFAPVLAVTTFRDESHVVEMANCTEYGLTSYVYTKDLARGHRMIDQLQTGMMGLNIGLVSNAAMPFGGFKSSGFGKEGSHEGLHEYLSTKYTLLGLGQ